MPTDKPTLDFTARHSAVLANHFPERSAVPASSGHPALADFRAALLAADHASHAGNVLSRWRVETI